MQALASQRCRMAVITPKQCRIINYKVSIMNLVFVLSVLGIAGGIIICVAAIIIKGIFIDKD